MIALYHYLPQFVTGTLLTIELALLALILGCLLSVMGVTLRLSKYTTVQWLTQSSVLVIRGIPELLVLFLVYFGGTGLLSLMAGHYVAVSSFVAGVIALALIFASYGTEVLRAAYGAISQGQNDAAQAYGFSQWYSFTAIILPQLWRHALPGFGNLWLVLLKDTALVSLLGLVDLMGVAQYASIYTENPFLFYSVAALIYLLLTSGSMAIHHWLTLRSRRCLVGEK